MENEIETTAALEPEQAAPVIEESEIAEPDPTPEPQPKRKRAAKKKRVAKKRSTSKTATLEDVAMAYLANLENEGASTSTVAGYTAELKRAMAALGADKPAADLTEDAVRRYMRSKRVTTKRDGKKRDEKTVARTRRVLRLALVFAEGEGLVKKAPVPEKI